MNLFLKGFLGIYNSVGFGEAIGILTALLLTISIVIILVSVAQYIFYSFIKRVMK